MELHEWSLALILGAVQGLSEFLPISSSAHLIVFSWFLSGKPLPLALNIAMHMGTLASLVIFFWRQWWSMAQALKDRLLSGRRSFEVDKLLPALIIGSLPAAILGILGKSAIETYFHHPQAVILPLIVGGLLLWYSDKTAREAGSLEQLTLKKSWIIGLAQALALIPGLSRSGITITAGRYVGFDRAAAARFSFLLGTPAMVGAALLESREILEHISEPLFYGGMISSCVVGCLAIKFFLAFIQRYGFFAFALYRLALASLLFFISL